MCGKDRSYHTSGEQFTSSLLKKWMFDCQSNMSSVGKDYSTFSIDNNPIYI